MNGKDRRQGTAVNSPSSTEHNDRKGPQTFKTSWDKGQAAVLGSMVGIPQHPRRGICYGRYPPSAWQEGSLRAKINNGSLCLINLDVSQRTNKDRHKEVVEKQRSLRSGFR